MMIPAVKKTAVILFLAITGCSIQAQFYDDFNGNQIEGWYVMTGDGNATMLFKQEDGFARMYIDATADRYNVYWTLIKRDITKHLNLALLKDTSYQLRVEAKVRVHNAPRRVNFMVNTQRTINFHLDLMEYDLQDTNKWHTISMTTKRFDAVPGDQVFVQFAATDFGPDRYQIDIDYYRADIVKVNEAGPDKGPLVPYHPPVTDITAFKNHLKVNHDCMIHSDFPDVNFNNWTSRESEININTLTVHANQWIILRWDLKDFKNTVPFGSGLLELTTHSLSKGGNYVSSLGEDYGIEFGKIRIYEILGGDPAWDQQSVTYHSLLGSQTPDETFNAQMVFDADVNEIKNGKTYITLSKYVMQRLLDGTTKGLLIKPLGAVDATFFSSESDKGPILHFNEE